MDRVFTELTPECEITARMYAQGYEKKEIANLKCRAVSTVNNQLQKAFDVLQDRKSTRQNSSHGVQSRMPSSA